MTHSTGPPDWNGFGEGAVVILLLYLAIMPIAYVADELSGDNVASVYVSHNA